MAKEKATAQVSARDLWIWAAGLSQPFMVSDPTAEGGTRPIEKTDLRSAETLDVLRSAHALAMSKGEGKKGDRSYTHARVFSTAGGEVFLCRNSGLNRAAAEAMLADSTFLSDREEGDVVTMQDVGSKGDTFAIRASAETLASLLLALSGDEIVNVTVKADPQRIIAYLRDGANGPWETVNVPHVTSGDEDSE